MDVYTAVSSKTMEMFVVGEACKEKERSPIVRTNIELDGLLGSTNGGERYERYDCKRYSRRVLCQQRGSIHTP